MNQRTLDAESWKRPSREQEDSFREVQVNVRAGPVSRRIRGTQEGHAPARPGERQGRSLPD